MAKLTRRSETTTKVFVGSLPPGVTADDLRRLFEPYGAIAECDISNKCGFLHLEDHDLAMKAIAELNGTNFMGGRISVEKGRVKPRRPGGPMRGGKNRGGPYARNEPRGPPRIGGPGGNMGRGFPPPYGDDGGGVSYDRPDRGPFDGGYGDRRPPYDDRRGGYGADRRPFGGPDWERGRRPYPDDRSPYPTSPRDYGDRRTLTGGNDYDDRRGPMNDRRPLLDQQGPPPPPRGPSGYDRAPNPTGELYSRRDSAPKPFDRPGYTTGMAPPPNGYGYGTGPVGGYGAPLSGGSAGGVPQAGYATANSGYSAPPPTAPYDGRASAAATAGYTTNVGYSTQGGYGDAYGAPPPPTRGAYDAAYPPLPQQRNFASGGGPGPRRDMVPGRRY